MQAIQVVMPGKAYFGRGLVFKFARKDYEASIEEMKRRIILFDKMIDAPINPSEFKKGEWYVDDVGVLQRKT